MFTTTLAILLLAPAADVKLDELSLTVGKDTRTALVAKPTKESKSAPLVFVWHGHGGTAKHAARTMDIHTHWPEAVCVYPQGLPTAGKLTDPEGKKAGWQMTSGGQDDRDLKFFDDLLSKLKKDHTIDESRIYSTGHSNGGGFTYLLWDQRPDVFAALAPCAAALLQLKSFKPLPCLHIASESDPLVKYSWQEIMIERIKKGNGVEKSGTEYAKDGKLVATKYVAKEAPPVVVALHPGGHAYPAEAPKLIAKFFQENEKVKEKK
jgi:polyhydroxybutyrate depolymerase